MINKWLYTYIIGHWSIDLLNFIINYDVNLDFNLFIDNISKSKKVIWLNDRITNKGTTYNNIIYPFLFSIFYSIIDYYEFYDKDFVIKNVELLENIKFKKIMTYIGLFSFDAETINENIINIRDNYNEYKKFHKKVWYSEEYYKKRYITNTSYSTKIDNIINIYYHLHNKIEIYNI